MTQAQVVRMWFETCCISIHAEQIRDARKYVLEQK